MDGEHSVEIDAGGWSRATGASYSIVRTGSSPS